MAEETCGHNTQGYEAASVVHFFKRNVVHKLDEGWLISCHTKRNFYDALDGHHYHPVILTVEVCTFVEQFMNLPDPIA